VVAPADEVGHLHEEADQPDSDHHHRAVTGREDAGVASIVTDVHVAVDADSPDA